MLPSAARTTSRGGSRLALRQRVYRFCERNQVQTAKLLGISRNIVRARLAHHGEIALRPRLRAEPGFARAPPPSRH